MRSARRIVVYLEGTEIMNVKCKELMTRAPDYCSPTATVQQVGALMKGRHVGVIPVVDSKKLVGIVTDRDLAINVLGNAAATKQMLIGEVMSTPPISCWEDEDVEIVAGLMRHHKITQVPVVNDDAFFVGVISLADIADCLQNPELNRDLIHTISKPDECQT